MIRAALLATTALLTIASAQAQQQLPKPIDNIYRMVNGKIYDPGGTIFVPRGVAISPGSASSDAAAAIKAIPGLNFFRVETGPPYPAAASFKTFLDTMRAQHIVVSFGDHSASNGSNTGGGQGEVFTGDRLAQELAFYEDFARTYPGVQYPGVWYGTTNEPTDKPSVAALGAWQQQIIDRIRSTGNNNPIMLELDGGGNPAMGNSGVAIPPSVLAKDHNIAMGPHFYGWLANYSTIQAVVAQGLQALVDGARSVKTADGTPPVVIMEYGNATDPNGKIDANGQLVVAAVLALAKQNIGSVAWAWNQGNPGNGLITPGGSLSADYGMLVANGYAAIAGSLPRSADAGTGAAAAADTALTTALTAANTMSSAACTSISGQGTSPCTQAAAALSGIGAPASDAAIQKAVASMPVPTADAATTTPSGSTQPTTPSPTTPDPTEPSTSVQLPTFNWTGSIVKPGSGSVTDAAGQALVITANGSIKDGQTWVAGGGGTAELTTKNGVLYGLDAHNRGWFTFSKATQVWTPSAAP